jgi:hypothetical protein
MIDSGYLRGTAIRDASKGGMTVAAAVTEITLEGRLFLQRLKTEEEAASIAGRLKANWPLFSGLVGVIVGWLLSSWHPFAQRGDTKPSAQPQTVATSTPKAIHRAIVPTQPATPKL